MKTVKKTAEHTIVQKRSGRYAVRSAQGSWINGEDKIAVLAKEGLVKPPAKKAPPAEEPVAVEEPAGEAATDETAG